MLPESTGNNWPGSKQESWPRHRIFPPQGDAVTLVITSRTTGPDICPPFYEAHKLRSEGRGEVIVENADVPSKCPQLKYCISSSPSLPVCNLGYICYVAVKLLQLSRGGLRA